MRSSSRQYPRRRKRPEASGPLKLYDLAVEWKTYPRLLEGLCERAGIPITIGESGRRPRLIDARDKPRLRLFFASNRTMKGASKGAGHHWHPIA